MLPDTERLRLTTLFVDTITLLCRSGLPSGAVQRVDALIGVTLSGNEVVLVNVNHQIVPDDDSVTPEPESIFSLIKENDDAEIEHEVAVENDQDDFRPSSGPSFDSYLVKSEVTSVSSDIFPVEYGTYLPASANEMLDIKLNSPSNSVSDDDCIVVKSEHFDHSVQQGDVADPREKYQMTPLSIAKHSSLAIPSSTKSSVMPSSSKNASLAHKRQASLGKTHRNSLRTDSSSKSLKMSSKASPMSLRSQLASSCHTFTPSTGQLDTCETTTSAGNSIVHFDSSPFTCDVCGAVLSGRQALMDHIRATHLSMCCYRCNDCGQTFKWRSTLKRHRAVCSGACHGGGLH